MSITPTAKKTPTWRSRLALFSAIGIGITGVPLALAAPAQAETSYRGCTVDPLEPQSRGNGRVDFKIKVHCRDGRTVQIRQLRFEDERRNDHYLGSSWFRESFDRHDKAVTLHSYDWVPNYDRRGPEKVYHLVSFRVSTDHGRWSNWTHWEESDLETVRR